METAVRELVKALLKTLYTDGLLTGEIWERARLDAERAPIRLPGRGSGAKDLDDP